MEKEIINIALENLNHQPKIHAEWIHGGGLDDGSDGFLDFVINGKGYRYTVVIKKELRQYQLPQIEEQRTRLKNILVIAEQIFPKLKEQLRASGIPYLEANGNFFLQTEECFYFIDTNKKVRLRKEKANRAFTKTGLKIVFHLLYEPELVNKTQREIADIAGVALGNIPQVINGLKETGYLLKLKKGIWVWDKKEELIDRWINEYATELRPRLKIGTYSLEEDWQNIELERTETVWGGEPAADILTNHLRPEKFILHTKESNLDLIRKYKFLPNDTGELEVLDMFWDSKKTENMAPPLLIYAELVIKGGKRNIETAQLIYNDYIKPKL